MDQKLKVEELLKWVQPVLHVRLFFDYWTELPDDATFGGYLCLIEKFVKTGI